MKSWHIFLLLSALAAMSAAQQTPVAPLPASGPAYAKYKNKFYIQGGSIGPKIDHATGQFFALDLSKPWTSESPAWIRLPDGPQKYDAGAAISLDGKIFYTSSSLFQPTAHRFFFENNTWSISTTALQESIYTVSPVTLETDGQVLILGGYNENITNMCHFYTFDTDQYVFTQLSPAAINGTQLVFEDYEAVWSRHLKQAVFIGGLGSSQGMTLYEPKSKKWEKMETFGGADRYHVWGHCVATTDDGKTLLAYGGYPRDTRASSMMYQSNLYILNLTTGVWTQGMGSSLGHGSAACTVAGDYFLLWGGSLYVEGENHVFDIGLSSTPVYLYQISRNAWVNQYQPSTDYLDPDPPSPTTSSSPAPSPTQSNKPPDTDQTNLTSDSKLNIGAIAGGVAGAVVVVVVIVFLVWRNRKRRAKHHGQQGNPSSEDDHRYSQSDNKHHHHAHGTKRMPQTLPYLESLRSPHAVDGFDYQVHDGNERPGKHEVDDLYVNTHSDPPSASRSPSTPAPQRSQWGTDTGGGHIVDEPWYSQTSNRSRYISNAKGPWHYSTDAESVAVPRNGAGSQPPSSPSPSPAPYNDYIPPPPLSSAPAQPAPPIPARPQGSHAHNHRRVRRQH